MSSVAHLRTRAQEEASRFPALLARAEHLAGTVLLGDHGRRRAGLGDDFWHYRPLHAGDSFRHSDWGRSARGDVQFVREREWQIAQSVQMWVDPGASMRFSSHKDIPTKSDRARLTALATAVLLVRGGERVGLTAKALFVSDFLGDLAPVEAALTKAADRGVRGVLFQVLDPSEEAFPFHGRTIFESVNKSVAYETLKANDLRDRYLERLAVRKDRLDTLCRLTGWQYFTHHTDHSAQSALLWVYRALDGSQG